MDGIQQFTEHAKTAGDEVSFSIIFRQLTLYAGKCKSMESFNKRVIIDWKNNKIPRAWKVRPDLGEQQPGLILSLEDFNKRRIHPVKMCSLSVRNGFVASIVLYSEQNIVNNYTGTVWFIGYRTDKKKSMSLNHALLASYKMSNSIAIFKKVTSGRAFLGNFCVSEAIELQQRMYFSFVKHE